MLHPYASEFVAGVACLALLAFAIGMTVYRPSTASASHRVWELLCYLVSTACMCRFLAQGARCKWPQGVSYQGRVAVVVGASSGVGYAVAEELAEHGWTVILAGHDLHRLLSARERLFYSLEEKKAIQKQPAPLRVVLPWLPRRLRAALMGYKKPIIHGFNVVVLSAVNLASEASVRSFADTLSGVESTYPVSLLVNAAGVMHRHTRYCPSYTQWAGLETMIATNAVGPQLLTRLLLPLLESTADKTGVTSRIVNVASSCHTWLYTSVSQIFSLPGRRAAPPDPIEMLYGLECKAPVVKTTPDTAAEASPPRPIRDAYKIEDFSLTNFVGYYGLSKLCVVWNTLLMARLLSHPRYRFSNGADKSNKTTPTSAAGASSSASPPQQGGGTQYKIYIACCHPGVIVTGLYRELFAQWVLNKILCYPSLVMGKTWHEGAQSALKIAIETDAMHHGGYYLCSGEYGPDSGVNCLSKHATDPEAMKAYAVYLAQKLGDDFGAKKPIHPGTATPTQ